MNFFKSLAYLCLFIVFVACSGDDNYTPIDSTDDTQTTDDTTDPTDDSSNDPDPIEPVSFLANLSDMGVFDGVLSELNPAEGVFLYELNSTLFTDYAAKQRLIKLPGDLTMEYAGDDQLPDFPDNTIIAKTFYYNIDDRDPTLGKQIIETRILLKIDGAWQAGDYLWNAEQTEATYDEDGGEVPISYIDSDGTTQNVNYLIPSRADCAVCHFNNTNMTLIGPKLRSMNFNPMSAEVSINQLQHFINNGWLTGSPDPASMPTLPDWTDDIAYDIRQRTRAYIDINCAHCHNPNGVVATFPIDFRYETPFDDTGIFANRGEIEARMQSTLPTYRMPQLGRTVVHDEAIVMLLEYIEAIEE